MAHDRARPPATLHTLLSSTLRRIDHDSGAHDFAVWRVWQDAVGEFVAGRARPLRARNGVLIVEVANHSLQQQLQSMKATLLARLNEKLHPIVLRDLMLVAGNPDDFEPPTAAGSRPTSAEAALKRAHQVVIPELSDDRLTDAFTAVVAARTRRAKAARRSGIK